MSDDEGFSNGVANEAKKELIRVGQHYNQLIVTIVSLACVVGLALILVLLVGMSRLEDFARTNRRLNEQNAKLLAEQQRNNDFGLKAVLCILDNFAEHRFTNQEIHDRIAEKLRIPPTPHSPLPERASDQQFHDDCGLFNRR